MKRSEAWAHRNSGYFLPEGIITEDDLPGFLIGFADGFQTYREEVESFLIHRLEGKETISVKEIEEIKDYLAHLGMDEMEKHTPTEDAESI